MNWVWMLQLNYELPYPSAQWAAVITHSSEIKEPVQKDPPLMKTATTHGNSLGVASTPLMMRAALGIPQPATADQICNSISNFFNFSIKWLWFTNHEEILFGWSWGWCCVPCVECEGVRTLQARPISLPSCSSQWAKCKALPLDPRSVIKIMEQKSTQFK